MFLPFSLREMIFTQRCMGWLSETAHSFLDLTLFCHRPCAPSEQVHTGVHPAAAEAEEESRVCVLALSLLTRAERH